MRHQKLRDKLGRTSSHRRSMLANMTVSLMLHEKIKTTEAKAKAVRRVAEKLITLGKRGSLHARRLAMSRFHDHEAIKKVFDNLALRYADRKGGYTRITKISNRIGDGAPMAVIELVDREEKKADGAKGEPAKRSVADRVRSAFRRGK